MVPDIGVSDAQGSLGDEVRATGVVKPLNGDDNENCDDAGLDDAEAGVDDFAIFSRICEAIVALFVDGDRVVKGDVTKVQGDTKKVGFDNVDRRMGKKTAAMQNCDTNYENSAKKAPARLPPLRHLFHFGLMLSKLGWSALACTRQA